MKRSTRLYILLVILIIVLTCVAFFGKHLILTFFSPAAHSNHKGVIDQTTPENREAIRLMGIRDAQLEAWSKTWFHNMLRKKYDTHVSGYDIIKTHDSTDSGENVYSLVISRNDSIKFRTEIGVTDSMGVEYVLYPLIPNGRKQVIVFEYTGGAHCCSMYWILDLADTIHVLYHSDEEETEIGDIGRIYDIDNDGRYEFTQYIRSFHYFDKLCGACSPGADAIFKYSDSLGGFRLANREFPSVNLEAIEKKKLDVKQFLDTTRVFNQELSTELLGVTLDVLIHYVYAGQDSIGWAHFDRNYVLPDKAEMKAKIQAVFNTSVVYRDLYPQQRRRRITNGKPPLVG